MRKRKKDGDKDEKHDEKTNGGNDEKTIGERREKMRNKWETILKKGKEKDNQTT